MFSYILALKKEILWSKKDLGVEVQLTQERVKVLKRCRELDVWNVFEVNLSEVEEFVFSVCAVTKFFHQHSDREIAIYGAEVLDTNIRLKFLHKITQVTVFKLYRTTGAGGKISNSGLKMSGFDMGVLSTLLLKLPHCYFFATKKWNPLN